MVGDDMGVLVWKRGGRVDARGHWWCWSVRAPRPTAGLRTKCSRMRVCSGVGVYRGTPVGRAAFHADRGP